MDTIAYSLGYDAGVKGKPFVVPRDLGNVSDRPLWLMGYWRGWAIRCETARFLTVAVRRLDRRAAARQTWSW